MIKSHIKTYHAVQNIEMDQTIIEHYHYLDFCSIIIFLVYPLPCPFEIDYLVLITTYLTISGHTLISVAHLIHPHLMFLSPATVSHKDAPYAKINGSSVMQKYSRSYATWKGSHLSPYVKIWRPISSDATICD